MELSGKKVYGSVLKTTQLSAHAQNHATLERCRNQQMRTLYFCPVVSIFYLLFFLA